MLPPSLRDWLPENHLAYFASDLAEQLDLSAIYAVHEKEARGQPPYDPRMMTKLLVYGYCVGVCSARKIEQRVVEDVAFRVLAAGNAPDFRTLADFRKIHRKALEGFFEQVLRMVLEVGAVQVGRAAETDAAEDRRYGKNRRRDELPEELPRRETRLARIREAKKALQERAREEAKADGKPGEEAKPAAKEQYHFTDPESRILKSSSEGFVQAYNAQIAVEPAMQLDAVDCGTGGDAGGQRPATGGADGRSRRGPIGTAAPGDAGR